MEKPTAQELEEIFLDLRKRGICATRKDLAGKIGCSYHQLCSAMNGDPKALTSSLLAKVKSYYRTVLGDVPPEPARDVIIPASTAQLYNNLVEVVRSQQETIARLVETLRVPGTPAPKNGLQTDRL